MCYRPLRILNPSKEFSYRNKFFLEVPCGKCAQCRARKVSDFGVRAYFEGIQTSKLKGAVYFCTFTYSDANAPYAVDEETGEMFLAFCKRDIQLYFKQLRKKLGFECVRYLLSCEYGDATNRPHYHAIIYINKPLDAHERYTTMLEIKFLWQGVRKWRISKKDVKDLKHGTCSIEEIGYKENWKAFFYVAKYIAKQDYYKFEEMPEDCKPFHLSSKGFGKYMIEYYGLKPNKTHNDTLQYMLDGTITMPFGKTKVVPMYISKKLLYDYEYKQVIEEYESDLKRKKVLVKYHLNDFGLYVKKYQSYRKIEQTLNEIKNNLNYGTIKSLDINKANEYLHSDFESTESLYQFVKNSLCHVYSYENLALYISTFKDRVILPYSDDSGFAPFGKKLLPSGEEFHLTKQNAYDYLDTIFSDDIRYYDSINPFDKTGEKYFKQGKAQNYIDVVSSMMYNSYFPPQYDLLCNILNFILYVRQEQISVKQLQLEYSYDKAKKLTPNTI